MNTPGTFLDVRKKITGASHCAWHFGRGSGALTCTNRRVELEALSPLKGNGQITLRGGDVTVHFYFERQGPA